MESKLSLFRKLYSYVITYVLNLLICLGGVVEFSMQLQSRIVKLDIKTLYVQIKLSSDIICFQSDRSFKEKQILALNCTEYCLDVF